MSTQNTTESFNQNYETLKKISETLRNQREPNIDELIPMVEQATQAYKVCQGRLAAVKTALDAYLPKDNSEILGIVESIAD